MPIWFMSILSKTEMLSLSIADDWLLTSCTQIANSAKLPISVITVDDKTATPKRVLTTLSSLIMGNTIPTEWDANNEA